jgi:hypothetical protein
MVSQGLRLLFNRIHRSGMSTFAIIWFGPWVSLLGTVMTRFALLKVRPGT